MLNSLKQLKKINEFKMLEASRQMGVFQAEVSKNNKQEKQLEAQIANQKLDIKTDDVLYNMRLLESEYNSSISSIQALRASREFLANKISQTQSVMNAISKEKEKYDYLISIEIKKQKKLKQKKQNKALDEFVYARYANTNLAPVGIGA